jgi:hypothetical protein
MLGAADLIAIKLEILHATISAFALRGFSGDLEFHLDEPPVKAEMYLKPNGSLSAVHRDVLKSLADSWPSIDTFVDRPGTFLLVRYSYGIITRVDTNDISHTK